MPIEREVGSEPRYRQKETPRSEHDGPVDHPPRNGQTSEFRKALSNGGSEAESRIQRTNRRRANPDARGVEKERAKSD